jgi:type VII secretion integral membrane protein EccD
MALPTELPLREILPAVKRLVVPVAQNGHGGDPGDLNEDTGGELSQLSLAPIGGAPFSLDASLDTVGVVDGDLLALQPVPIGPAAPGIVEDIADAAVIFSTSRRKPWGAAHIQLGALAAAIAVALLATGLAVTYRVAAGGGRRHARAIERPAAHRACAQTRPSQIGDAVVSARSD